GTAPPSPPSEPPDEPAPIAHDISRMGDKRTGRDRPRVPPKPARPMGKVLKVSLAGLSAPQDARTNGSEWGRPRRSHPPRSMRRDSVAATSSIRSSAIAMAEPRVGDQVPLVTKPTSRLDLRTRSPWVGG